MSVPPPALTAAVLHRSWARQTVCRKHALSRYLSCSAKSPLHTKSTAHGSRNNEGHVVSFESLGVQKAIAAALSAAFPEVQQPTAMQRKLISAVVGRRDVILQDFTGSGKSFGLLLGLLSKPRVQAGITTLLVVPHRDLAYQFLHWLHRILTSAGEHAPYSLASISQVLVRGSPPENTSPRILEAIANPSSSGITVLRQCPPHILISTPTALMDVLGKDPDVLQLSKLSTVVVDEVDSLLQVVPQKGSKHDREKAERLIANHPPVLKTVLDVLYSNAKTNGAQSLREHLLDMKLAPIHRPQLIVLSATMRNRLRTTLFGSYGWFSKGQVLQLIKASSSSRAAHGLNQNITHHVIVVSQDGSATNIRGARKARIHSPSDSPDFHVEEEFITDECDETPLDEGTDPAILQAPAVFAPGMLEVVATAFALDVPNIALLVVPATASVRQVIFELRQLGVNAHGLSLVENEGGIAHLRSKNNGIPDENPTLLVSTLATTRGIDLPGLTHVFLLGLPEGRTGDVYVHVAGRVGRFGRRGKVVTVLEGCREEKGKQGKSVMKDDSKKMGIMLKKLGIFTTELEHFD